MGFLKVLQLSVVYNTLWTNTIDWFDLVHIRLMELFYHNKLLIFKKFLDLITTLGMISQEDQITLWDGQFFPPVLRALSSALFLMLFNAC